MVSLSLLEDEESCHCKLKGRLFYMNSSSKPQTILSLGCQTLFEEQWCCSLAGPEEGEAVPAWAAHGHKVVLGWVFEDWGGDELLMP